MLHLKPCMVALKLRSDVMSLVKIHLLRKGTPGIFKHDISIKIVVGDTHTL